ncbi:hypothetical protein F511_09526 [Dorcoceras hygrometricum]|uniref:Uncharacterized protein n=1 Tax=Dorcoceras hygrometricum TaxID=472368 RepID=A0A2Z7CPE8_9LAMI|nr:hypothetical protein F511_09526 [Dorcoceras hygrometricum]
MHYSRPVIKPNSALVPVIVCHLKIGGIISPAYHDVKEIGAFYNFIPVIEILVIPVKYIYPFSISHSPSSAAISLRRKTLPRFIVIPNKKPTRQLRTNYQISPSTQKQTLMEANSPKFHLRRRPVLVAGHIRCTWELPIAFER